MPMFFIVLVRDGDPNYVWLGLEAHSAIFCGESTIMRFFGIYSGSKEIGPIRTNLYYFLSLGFLIFTHYIFMIFFEIVVFSFVLIFNIVNYLLLCPWFFFFSVLGFHVNFYVLILFFYCLFYYFRDSTRSFNLKKKGTKYKIITTSQIKGFYVKFWKLCSWNIEYWHLYKNNYICLLVHNF